MRDPPSVRTLPRAPRAGRPVRRVPLVLCQEMGISPPRPSRPPPPQHRPRAPRVPGTSRRGRPPHGALGALEAAGARVPRGGARRGRQWGCGGREPRRGDGGVRGDGVAWLEFGSHPGEPRVPPPDNRASRGPARAGLRFHESPGRREGRRAAGSRGNPSASRPGMTRRPDLEA